MQKIVQDWWEQAQEDLKVAEDNLKNHHYVTAFFSQQAVEKGFKALFISKFKKSAPRTHDLTSLCDKLNTPEKVRLAAERLTPTYIFTRYPEVAEKVPAKFYSQEQASDFLKLAREVLQWIKEELKP